MSTGHSHTGSTGGKLRTAFFLSFVILGVEIAGGIFSHSLALLSDAGHVLTDLVALGLAWSATVQSQRPADARKTYGYHRTGILAALLNALTLILIVGFIAFEALHRFHEPPTVAPTLMFVSAAVGIIVNLYIGLGLRESGKGNVNVRAAMLHVFGDVAASVGVVIAALAIALTKWYPADAVISLAIATLIAKGAWDLMRETIDILMESTPKDVNIAQLVRDIVRVPGVRDVHDLHVWSIAGGVKSLSAHLQVEGDRVLSQCDALLLTINEILNARYGIGHTTIQFECANCSPNHRDLYCSISSDAPNTDHEHHRHETSGDGLDVAKGRERTTSR